MITVAVTFNRGMMMSVLLMLKRWIIDIPVRSNLNQMKMSPDSKWVVCYHDISANGGGSTTGGAVSLMPSVSLVLWLNGI